MNENRSEKLWHKAELGSDFDPAARAAWRKTFLLHKS